MGSFNIKIGNKPIKMQGKVVAGGVLPPLPINSKLTASIKEIPIEIIKEVPVEVIKEIKVEVPVEKIIIKEVPIETIREVIKEVPIEKIITKEVIKNIEIPVIRTRIEYKTNKLAFISSIILALLCGLALGRM